jgi:beta-galactosidase
MGKTVQGKPKYCYGGDFGETLHDGNFCMDGQVFPDLRPSTGLREYKNVIRPVRASLAGKPEDAVVRFRNMRRFTGTAGIIEARYTVTQNGRPAGSGALPLDLGASESKDYKLNYTVPGSGICYLNIEYVQTADASLTKAGHILGRDQLELRRDPQAVEKLRPPAKGTAVQPVARENDREIELSSPRFRYVFNKRRGIFDALVFGNRVLLEKPMEYNVWRAPTDNDRNVRGDWQGIGYHHPVTRVYETVLSQEGQDVVIRSVLSLAAPPVQRFLDITAVWRIGPDGSIALRADCARNPALPFLPRFGVRLFMPRALDTLEYLGYGPTESYLDKHEATWYGMFRSTVAAEHVDYPKPQENGGHWGCDRLLLTDSYGTGLLVERDEKRGDAPFSFNVSPYTQEELTARGHSFEIEPCGSTVFCLDYTQSGIGSNSCGPGLSKQYRLDAGEFSFSVTIRPQG